MSGDQPPVGPEPADQPPVQPSDQPVDEPVETPLVPPSPPGPPPPVAWPGGPTAPNPYAEPPRPGGPTASNPYAEPARPGPHWALVVLGALLGFVAWVVGSFLVIAVTGSFGSSANGGATVALVVLVLLFLASVGLIVWPRTRRLGQGLVLGAAIGLVVAGGLCIPLVASF